MRQLPDCDVEQTGGIMKEYICIDIGGTSIKYGVIGEDRKFSETGEMPTEAEKGGADVLEKAAGIADRLRKKYRISGICVSTAGMVDPEEGKIIYAAPLIPDYTGTEIRKTMEERFHIPCSVENDVNCAGMAEALEGSGKGSPLCVCLTVGTGIGGAIIMDGKLVRGSSGSACEVGYMHLPGGAFQDIAASSVLVRQAAWYKQISPDQIDGRYVFEQAKAGDECCIRAIDEMTDALGMGIANICYVLNPGVVILGGGIMAQREYLRERIEKSMEKYLLPSVLQQTRLEFAGNGNHAGMLGAYLCFLDRQAKK